MIPPQALLGAFPDLALIIIGRHASHMAGELTDQGRDTARKNAMSALRHLQLEYPKQIRATDSIVYASAPAIRAQQTSDISMSVLGPTGIQHTVLPELDDNRMEVSSSDMAVQCRNIVLALAKLLTKNTRVLFITAHLPHAEQLPQFLVPHFVQGKLKSLDMGSLRILDTDNEDMNNVIISLR